MAESDSRQRILEVALHLFAHRGYGSTSVREVVEAAGVTKPTMYYYFDNKEALFREVISWKMEAGERALNEAMRLGGSVEDQLRRVVKTWITEAASDLDGLRLLMTCGLPQSEGQPEVDLMERHLRNIEPLAALIAHGQQSGTFRRGVDPRLAVMALMGSLNLQLMALLKGHPFGNDVVDGLFDTWLHGVSA